MREMIAAPATAMMRSERAMVRVSGDGALALGERLLGQSCDHSFITRGRIDLSTTRTSTLPLPVEIWAFAKGRSFTSEETLEIHMPGAPLVVEMVLERLRAEGVEDAEAGEFTRRAYLNGKLDLAQSEAVMALVSSIDAEGAQRARRLLEGSFSARIESLVRALEMLCARFEVAFDFDEEAAEQVDEERFQQGLRELAASLNEIRKGGFPQSADKARVLLVGATNVGKSTLFNALLGKRRAAVADELGTTRDEVRQEALIEGMEIELIDSAGLLKARNQIEEAALEHLYQLCINADLVLGVVRADDQAEEIAKVFKRAEDHGASILMVRTMLDRCADWVPLSNDLDDFPSIGVCAPKGEGVPELRLAMAQMLRQRLLPDALPVTARAAGLIHHADGALADALSALEGGMPLEVASDVARSALSDLRAFLGEGSGGDVLDVVFSSFCIGK